MGTNKGDGPPKQPDPGAGTEPEGALDHEIAVAVEPGPAAPVAAEVSDEVTARPALRDSMAAIGDDQPLTFPDDGGLARILRIIDNAIGNVEQAVLFGLLVVVVISGAVSGIAGKLGKTYPETDYLIRTGVLAIGMLGAAFASHQQRHLAMDLISRRLPPRGRLLLRLFLGAFTILVVAVLTRSVWHLFEQAADEHNANNFLPTWLTPLILPLGTGLVIVHTLLHLVIDADYLARGKLPPERARSAH